MNLVLKSLKNLSVLLATFKSRWQLLRAVHIERWQKSSFWSKFSFWSRLSGFWLVIIDSCQRLFFAARSKTTWFIDWETMKGQNFIEQWLWAIDETDYFSIKFPKIYGTTHWHAFNTKLVTLILLFKQLKHFPNYYLAMNNVWTDYFSGSPGIMWPLR